jgi:hypothetical protein
MKIKLATVPVLMMAVFFCPYFKAHAQGCASSAGASNGVSFSTLSYSGSTFSWTNPDNAQTADNNYATASKTLGLGILASQYSDYLTVENFGFSIPSFATICEIHVKVERSASGLGVLGTDVVDQSVMLLKNGALYGNDLASGAAWSASDAIATYGSGLLAGTWGGSWLPADINSSNFGVAISARLNGMAGLLMGANIDQVLVTVIYDPHSLLAMALENFTAAPSANGDGQRLSWSAGSGAPSCKYFIQRSVDSRNWKNIATVDGAFSYTDHTPLDGANFYRLRAESMDGRYVYSEVKEVVQAAASLRCWPNPFNAVINIAGSAGKVVLKDIHGRVIYTKNISAPGDWQIQTAGVPPGLYFIEIGNRTYKMLKQSN